MISSNDSRTLRAYQRIPWHNWYRTQRVPIGIYTVTTAYIFHGPRVIVKPTILLARWRCKMRAFVNYCPAKCFAIPCISLDERTTEHDLPIGIPWCRVVTSSRRGKHPWRELKCWGLDAHGSGISSDQDVYIIASIVIDQSLSPPMCRSHSSHRRRRTGSFGLKK